MGGWHRQGSGVPLAERARLAVASGGDAGGATGEHASPEPAACPGRHCWISDPVDGSGERRPGLLLEWSTESGAWRGRVVYPSQLRPGEWALVEEWVPAALLTPIAAT